MTRLTVRYFDPVIKDKLRLAVAAHGHSMEEEVRIILRSALAQQVTAGGLGSRIHARFAVLGGVDLELPERTELAHPAL